MNLKTSKFNHFTKTENFYVGYNFLRRSIIKTESQLVVETLEKIDGDFTLNSIKTLLQADDTDIGYLVKTGFLIDSNTDEISEIKFNYRKNLFNSDALRLIVLPTLKCNFDCPYCYEKKNNSRMTENTKDNLIKWIKSFMPNKSKLHISWFGGEPLLEKKTIYELSKKICSLSEIYHFRYSASLTTNGYLLTRDFIEKIDQLNIKQIQVTFDGNKEYHNKYRFLMNGNGSYDILIDNITQLVTKKPSDCSMIIRVNCTDDNFESINELLSSFPENIRSQISIFFRWVYSTKIKGFQDFSSKKKGREPYLNISKLNLEAQSLGWKVRSTNSKTKSNFCEVDFLDHYYLNPSGDLFLCSHNTEPEYSIGNINHSKIINTGKKNYISKWYSKEPFDDNMCLNCILLPHCLGGCRKVRMEGGRGCIWEKNSLNKYVIDIYNTQNKQLFN